MTPRFLAGVPLMVVVATVITACGSTSPATSNSKAPSARARVPRDRSQWSFWDGRRGLYIGDDGSVFATTDGARSSTRVSRLPGRLPSQDRNFYLSLFRPNIAIAEVDGCDLSCALSRRAFFESRDGGRLWQEKPVPKLIRGTDETETVDPVTPERWFASERFESNTDLELWLLRSDDAGRHWRRVTRPCRARGNWDYEFTGSLEFTDPNHGYVFCGSQPGTSDDHLWRVVETRDGGRHWRAVFGTFWRIPNPPPGGSRTVGDKFNIGGGYDFGVLGNSDRSLLTFTSMRTPSRFIYLSLDKGRHWVPLHVPIPPSECFPAGAVKMITMREAVYTCNSQILPNRSVNSFSTWKTADGGQHWRLLERELR